MTREQFEQKIGTVLRAHGTGVTADLTDELLAYWNGHAVAYVLICAEPPDTCFEEFAMDDVQWANWRSWLEAWIEAPTFSVRPEVHNWLSEELPAEAGE